MDGTPRRLSPRAAALLGVVAGMLVAGLVVPLLEGEERPVATGAPSTTGTAGPATARSADAATLPDSGGGAAGPGAGAAGGTGGDRPAGGAPGAAPGDDGAVATTAARAAAPSAGSARGVTATTVDVGIPLLDTGGLGAIGISVGVTPAQQRRYWDALLADVNDRGGAGGRRLRPAYVTYDVLSQDDQQAACLRLTQDERVFVVLTGFNYESANHCVVVANVTPMIGTATNNPDELYARAGGRLFTLYPRGGRMMVEVVPFLARLGAVRGQQVGVLDDAGGDPTGSAGGALAAAIRRFGGTPHVVQLSADLGAGSSQIPVVVSRLRAAGVTRVVLLANVLFSTQFVQQAESQGWRPSYHVTDWLAMHHDVGSANMPSSYDGAVGVVTDRINDHLAGIPPEPAEAECQRLAARRLGAEVPARGTDAHGYLMRSCSVVRLLAASLDAAGRDLDVGTWRAAMHGLGDRVPMTLWGPGRFAPGRPDYADHYRIQRWSADCRCWRPAGPYEAPPGGP